jgi:hypothetical protein
METPKPVDLSLLSGVLAKSMQVMSKIDGGTPIKENTSRGSSRALPPPSYNGSDDDDDGYGVEPIYEQQNMGGYDPSKENLNYTDEQVMNSNLPQAVKEAMIKNKIPRATSQSKVTAEAISRMTGVPIKKPNVITENTQTNSNPDMITLSKSELKEMINEGISTFFKQIYNKTVTEETIKKTINLLIKEGKINVKKK